MESPTVRRASLTELREKLQAITKLDPPPGWAVGEFLPSAAGVPVCNLTPAGNDFGGGTPVRSTSASGTERKAIILPQGALVEWCGDAAESALCHFFRRFPETQLAWMQRKITVYPPALPERGVALKRVFFLEVEASSDWAWSLQQCLRSGLFQFVVAYTEDLPEKRQDLFLRKCQLLGERSRTTTCLVSRKPISTYRIRHRIDLNEPHAFSRRSI